MKIKILTSAQSALRTWRCDGALLVMPFTDADQAARAAGLMAMRAGAPGLLLAVHDDAQEGFVRIVNRLFARSESPFFGYVAQDAFAGRCWLGNALKAMKDGAAKLLAFNDGKWFGTLAPYGLARRSWAKELYGGSLFYAGYRNHYADTELSMIAAGQHALAYAPGSVLLKMDSKKESARLQDADRELFQARSASGFDGKLGRRLARIA